MVQHLRLKVEEDGEIAVAEISKDMLEYSRVGVDKVGSVFVTVVPSAGETGREVGALGHQGTSERSKPTLTDL